VRLLLGNPGTWLPQHTHLATFQPSINHDAKMPGYKARRGEVEAAESAVPIANWCVRTDAWHKYVPIVETGVAMAEDSLPSDLYREASDRLAESAEDVKIIENRVRRRKLELEGEQIEDEFRLRDERRERSCSWHF
jgi:hypothetical protein